MLYPKLKVLCIFILKYSRLSNLRVILIFCLFFVSLIQYSTCRCRADDMKETFTLREYVGTSFTSSRPFEKDINLFISLNGLMYFGSINVGVGFPLSKNTDFMLSGYYYEESYKLSTYEPVSKSIQISPAVKFSIFNKEKISLAIFGGAFYTYDFYRASSMEGLYFGAIVSRLFKDFEPFLSIRPGLTYVNGNMELEKNSLSIPIYKKIGFYLAYDIGFNILASKWLSFFLHFNNYRFIGFGVNLKF